MAPTLLQRLVQLQQQHHLSDRAFARMLGISFSLWSKTRRQDYPIRYEVLAGAARAFPELEPDLLAYLRQTGHSRKG